jgi:Raf kinase inhibitor-like YbhB/YbcL family protein
MHLYEPILPFKHIHIDTGLLWRILLLLALLFAAPFLAGCRHGDQAIAAVSGGAFLTLSSASLQDGRVPREFTCDGEDKSPPLAWEAPPDGTKALALTVTDPDAPGGVFTHWVLYNLPASAGGLPAGVPKQAQLADGSRQGRSDFGKVGYNGPCPPPGNPHRYVFTLYALNSNLDVPAGATRAQLESAIQGHVVARGELTARYGR